MEYFWKINMNNGDKFIVKSDICNSNEFLKKLYGEHTTQRNINMFELAKSKSFKYGTNMDYMYESNFVSIASDSISSVEWLVNK